MDSLILQKIQAFAVRRWRLIVLRGVFTAVAMLLATMMIVALLDRFFLLPDWLRWTLSGVAYGAVLVAEWRACWRLLLHTPGPRKLARLIEETAPHLREDLLSAVELGDGEATFDSPQFRELLQADVASRMSGLKEGELLPVILLRRTILLFCVVLLALVGAFALSGGSFGSMLLRAMLPMANLARISTIQVAILEPNPAERAVAQGDTQALRVQATGGKVEKAYLETFSKSGRREVQQMTPAGNEGRFSATIQIAREDVEYRVRAGDAITRKYRLQASARPHVTVFHKTFKYPTYTQMPPKEVTEDSGDLVALEGTEVELRLETDQPVSKAELRLETGQSSAAVPLEKAPEGGLRGKITLSASGVYRVHLVAESSGFENKFSPEYELRANPDLIPKVTLERPQQDLVTSNAESIEFSGTATDDLSVSGVVQMYRVNEGDWKTLPLPIIAGPSAKVHNLWDLSQEHLRPGDQITAKLVAEDQKGNHGESRPIQITVADSGFDNRRAVVLVELGKLLHEIEAMRTSAEALEKRANEARSLFERPDPTPESSLAWTAVGEALDDYETHTIAVTAQMQSTLPQAAPGDESAALVLFSRAQARLEGSAIWLRGLQRVMADPTAEPVHRDLVREASETTHWLSAHAKQFAEVARSFVACQEIEFAAQNVQVVWHDQVQLADLAKNAGADAGQWAKVAARSKVVASEAIQVEETMKSAGSHAPPGYSDRLRHYLKRLQDQRIDVAKPAAGARPGNELLSPVLNYSNLLAETTNGLLELVREGEINFVNNDQKLRGDVLPAWSLFEQIHNETWKVMAQAKQPASIRAVLAATRWEERTSAWKKYGDFEELRPDADNYFVEDLRALALALPGLRGGFVSVDQSNQARQEAWKQFQKLDFGFRALETVHDLTELASGLETLASEEHWESRALSARTVGPGMWTWLELRLRSSPEWVGRIVQTTPEMRQTVQAAREILIHAVQDPAFRDVSDGMQRRYRKEEKPISKEESAQVLAARVRRAIELLQPARDDAKAVLAQMAPKLAERLAQLAKEAEELKKRTEEHAKSQGESPEASQVETHQELLAQQKLDRQVEAVKDAIRNDAQRQDVLKEEGRERARDADDALGMLREPPPRAEQALADAAASEKAEERQQATQSAAREQQKLASALEQIAKHYDALEQGKAEETRAAMRKAEEQLGLKPNLDQQFAQTDELAKAAEKSPDEMLKALEQALPKNPLMRQELSSVAKDVLHGAAEKLAQANAQEERVKQDVGNLATEQARQGTSNPPAPAPQPPAGNEQKETAANPATPAPPTQPNPVLAQAATQQAPIGTSATKAGEEVERAGRHEARLNHPENGEQLQRLGRQVQATGKEEVPQAREALEKATIAAQAQAPVNQASERLQHELGRLASAANGMPEETAKPETAAVPASPEEANASTPAQPAAPAKPGEGKPATSPFNQPGMPMIASVPPSPGEPANAGLPMPPPGVTAAPQQQIWMARALDSLDAAIHSQDQQAQQGAKDGLPSGQQPQPPNPNSAMTEAQQAMNSAAQAAAAAMRAKRSQAPVKPPKASTVEGGLDEKSEEGILANTDGAAGGPLPKGALNLRDGAWGHLPKQMAEQLSQGQHEGVSAEYKNQVETYYRVIAERAKKQ